MAKKKELNSEAAHIVNTLNIAIKLHKEAEVITHMGSMIAKTPVGTLFIPCGFDMSYAVRAIDLRNALKGCDTAFTLTEVGTEVVVSWGKRRAALETKSKVSIYVHPIDAIQMPDVDIDFTSTLHDVLKDVQVNNNNYSNFVKFTNGAAFWTNGHIGCMIQTGTYVPDILVYAKDLKAAVAYDAKDGDGNAVRIAGIGGSSKTITLHYSDGVAIQVPIVDDTAVKYPDIGKLFQPTLYDTAYELTQDHLEAIAYVTDFAGDRIYIEPTHIGTDVDPSFGTAVSTENLPLSLVVRNDVVKLGSFSKATHLIKNAVANNYVAFYTYRKNVTFCFVKLSTA